LRFFKTHFYSPGITMPLSTTTQHLYTVNHKKWHIPITLENLCSYAIIYIICRVILIWVVARHHVPTSHRKVQVHISKVLNSCLWQYYTGHGLRS